jgi:PAS domain S-box-containing protein
VYWTYSYGPIDDPDAPHGVGGVLVVCTETTDHVLAEQRMKAAEARWRSMFDQAPGFMCVLRGPDHVFEFANPHYHDLVGRRDLIGKSLREALPEVESQGFPALLDEVYCTGEAYSGTAAPVVLATRPEGSEKRYLDFVYQPIRNASDEVTGVFVAGYDVTERVAASEALREGDRRKDEFLAMLAHELRNPLAPIRNASELLTRGITDPRIRAIGDLLARQVTQLSRMVDDLLDVSRVTTGRIQLQQQPVELGHAIDLAIESVEPMSREKKHVVEFSRSGVLYVHADLARLVQAISNVLSNATKYTPAGGRIRVVLERQDDMAAVEIIDTGVGITAEMLPKVFELFSQDNRTLDRSQGGLGIGLSVVQRLVQMHGGDVVAMSEGLGQGSKFRIRLPLIDPPAAETSSAERSRPAAMRILVVDDNVDAADSLAQLLQVVGHEVKAVYSARETLELVETFGADIVLLDIGLPEMDGYEVARRMRARGSGPVLIAVTGYGQLADIQQARDAGFDRHLTKPVAFEELQQVLQESLLQPRPERRCP